MCPVFPQSNKEEPLICKCCRRLEGGGNMQSESFTFWFICRVKTWKRRETRIFIYSSLYQRRGMQIDWCPVDINWSQLHMQTNHGQHTIKKSYLDMTTDFKWISLFLIIMWRYNTLLFLLIITDDVVQCVQSIAQDFRVRPVKLAGRSRVLTDHVNLSHKPTSNT